MRTRAVSGTTLECILALVFVGGVTVENENAADWHSRPTKRLPRVCWWHGSSGFLFSYPDARCNFGNTRRGFVNPLLTHKATRFRFWLWEGLT